MMVIALCVNHDEMALREVKDPAQGYMAKK